MTDVLTQIRSQLADIESIQRNELSDLRADNLLLRADNLRRTNEYTAILALARYLASELAVFRQVGDEIFEALA